MPEETKAHDTEEKYNDDRTFPIVNILYKVSCQREGGWGVVKGVKYMVTEDDLTLGGRHTMQYTDHVS